MAPEEAHRVTVTLNGVETELPAEGTLLDALREDASCHSVKDGCSPQGQCGCCTVLVDGQARVSCVTPTRRVAGRSITTLEGEAGEIVQRLVQAFEATGAAQCGFCTPGIVNRLVGLARKGVPTEQSVKLALAAHLCRCTGFQPIVEAALMALNPDVVLPPARNEALAQQRATLESGVTQVVGEAVVTGAFRFTQDADLDGATVAYGSDDGGYVTAASISEARAASAKRQGRNSTVALRAPLAVPALDDAVLSLTTCFIEPAYLEPDASFCSPGGEPSPAFSNAGAFGAKRHSNICGDAQRLANELDRDVLALWPREETVRRGAKRPPVALALRADGSGVAHVAVTPGSDDLSGLLTDIANTFPDIEVSEVVVTGPRVGATHRGAVLAELLAAKAVVNHVAGEPFVVTLASGASASVSFTGAGIDVSVQAGDPLCAITLRSYVIGAVHQAFGHVTSEGLAIDEQGAVVDLTIRSFSIPTAAQTPPIEVVIEDGKGDAVAVGLCVYAATLAAVWFDEGSGPTWPTRKEVLR